MLLTACEGRRCRYEVCEHDDGYLVQMRDIVTGDVDDSFATLFRTMPVAFAYAEMSAALDLVAAAELEGADDDIVDAESCERTFTTLSDRLGDSGLNGGSMKGWEQVTSSGTRRVYH